MDEKKEIEGKAKEDPAEDSGEGNQPKVPKVTQDANAAAERLEKATAELKKENDRLAEIQAEKALSGDADASAPHHKETEDEKWAREAKARYAGTGMDPTPDKE